MALNIGDLVLNVAVNQSGLKDLSKTLSALGSTMGPIGAVAGKAIGAVVDFGKECASAFASVNQTMTLTTRIMGASAAESQMMFSTVTREAGKSIYTVDEAANAMLNFSRAGLSATEACEALGPAMSLAAGMGGDLATVSAGLTATLNAFGASFEEASHYADVFATAGARSALEINSLMNACSVAAPVFKSVTWSVEDMAAMMGLMADKGIDANVAANALKTGIARLAGNKNAAATLKTLGVSLTDASGNMKEAKQLIEELADAFSGLSETQKINKASELFGKNIYSSWIALLDTQKEDIESLWTSITEESEGSADAMAESMMSSFGGAIAELKSTWDSFKVTFGEGLAPALEPAIRALSDLIGGIKTAVDWMNGVDNSERTTKFGKALQAKMNEKNYNNNHYTEAEAAALILPEMSYYDLLEARKAGEMSGAGNEELTRMYDEALKKKNLELQVKTQKTNQANYGGMPYFSPNYTATAAGADMVNPAILSAVESLQSASSRLAETMSGIPAIFAEMSANAQDFTKPIQDSGLTLKEYTANMETNKAAVKSWRDNTVSCLKMASDENAEYVTQMTQKFGPENQQFWSDLSKLSSEEFNKTIDSFREAEGEIGDTFSSLESAIRDLISALNGIPGYKQIVIEEVHKITGPQLSVAEVGHVNANGQASQLVKPQTRQTKRIGESYVPYDGYIAELHKGERILTRAENEQYTKLKEQEGYGVGGSVVNNYNITVPNNDNALETARRIKEITRKEEYGFEGRRSK